MAESEKSSLGKIGIIERIAKEDTVLIVSPNDLEVRFRPSGIEVLALELQLEPTSESIEEAVA